MNEQVHPVLFRIYPELREKIHFIALGKFPTPVQKLESLGKVNLWIKRDDLDSDIYSGNKVRKLEFILADVLHRKKKKIITMGGIGTNHGLATGIYCSTLGLECKLLAFRQPITSFVKKNMLLFSKYITEIRYSSSVLKTVLSYYITERIRNPRAYFLYAGGSSPVGTIGFINAGLELARQIGEGLLPEPDYIFCPLGSNGTMAGLALGCRMAGLKTAVIGVRVTFSSLGPFSSCNVKTVQSLMKETYRYLKKRCPSLPAVDFRETPRIIGEYLGDGYGCPTENCRMAMTLAGEKENIILDPTYTAKTFAAFLDYAEKPGFKGKKLLYWHTYNSVDLSDEIDGIEDRDIHRCLRSLLEEEEQS